ncbi:transposase [Nonomuraea phyllanthi]|uniref:Transposase n=1 Tax=Nonomuraea phyllanthi TaxID=2219224 RepID=A0A5C4VDZ4_9ACTN|nr:transposase [Nonomuraea phyllanthi]QFY13359.1 transposase [Nonomuraea phyllanthi]
MDAIRYVADNGCKWRNLPADFLTPWRTVHAIFTRWWQDGDLYALHNDLREQVRTAEGREPEPSAQVMTARLSSTADEPVRPARRYGSATCGQSIRSRACNDAIADWTT